jgi:Zn-dependent M28 family amino/carboxypeptidase
MQEDMAALLVNGPRLAGSASEAAAAGHMESRLEDAGLEVLTHPVPLPNGSDSRNLITTVGDGPRHVLVGAHYDSIEGSPGADDNGSGTVVLLELARRLAEAPPRGLQVTLAWFGAEEVLPGYSSNDHHYGSRQMAARMEDAGTLPDEMLSVDMVGYDDAILAATYRDLDPAAAERLIEAGTAVGAVVTLSSRGDISDHEAFARAGVPAVMMWRPWNPGYHSAGDDTVNWNKILEDLAIVEAWLALQPS